MPIIDITKPEVIKFLVENYEKTARLRMKWNHINAAKLKQAATLQRKETGYREKDVVKTAMVAGMASTVRDNKSSARNRRLRPIRDGLHIPGVADLKTGHSIVDLGLGNPKNDPRLARADSDLTYDPIMRPVDPKQHKILYKSKPTFGREVYLENRYKSLSPENRFYFAETSGWVYGWRLKDSYFHNNAPQHGRVWHLTHGISRSGPHPDPIHYKHPGSDARKCP